MNFDFLEIPRNRYRVIGDVHGNYDEFKAFVDDALNDGRYILSLGDLEDRGPNPAKCVSLMMDLIEAGQGQMVASNHFWKHYRYHQGRPVQFHEEHEKTKADFEAHGIVDRYMDMFSAVPMFAHRDSFFFAHAAYHPVADEMINDNDVKTRLKKMLHERLIYGETNGETNDEGFPVRKLDWFDRVPEYRTVVVGHHVLSKDQILRFRTTGGNVIFLDLGSGKDGGQLAYIDIDDNSITGSSHDIVDAGDPSAYGAYRENKDG